MSEIKNLYENANLISHYCGDDYVAERMLEFECTDGDKEKCKTCDKVKTGHPPFTAEKQLNIIKWLLKNYDIGFSQLGERIDTSLDGVNCISGLGSGNTFEESLAQAINDLWQDLTEEERKQIKEILE